MTDTRNRNNPVNFAAEQRAASAAAEYHLFVPNHAASIPGRGLGTAGRVAPSRLSANYIAIDSTLRGIGVSNLVKAVPGPAVAQLYPLSVTRIVPDGPAVDAPRPAADALAGARPRYL